MNDNTMVEVAELCDFLKMDFASYFGDYKPQKAEGVFGGNY